MPNRTSARARQGKQAKTAKKADSAPIGRIPTFGTPAASGAGKTGFDLDHGSEAQVQGGGATARRKRAGTGQAHDRLCHRTGARGGPGASRHDGAASGQEAAQPKAAPKAVATKRVTAPKAPALLARQDFKSS